jgi:chemotaxis protein MotB
MKAPANGSVVIIKKKHRGHHGHHGGAWKVAYADFVTAMMAFFLVMWIVGQSKAVKAGVAGYFRNPSVLQGEGAAGILPGHTSGLEAEGPTPKEGGSVENELESLEKAAEKIRIALDQLPGLNELAGQIQITATPEGLRIELVESNSATFFDNASAVLKPATERILSVIAREIGALGRPVVVEGHTDSRLFANDDRYSNWELSADRANAARRQLERAGLPPELVRAVRGFADTQLAKPDDPLDSRNRRVSILVVPEAAAATRPAAAPPVQGGTPAPGAPDGASAAHGQAPTPH